MKMTEEPRSARCCFAEALPGWLIPLNGDETVRGVAGQAMLGALSNGEAVDAENYLHSLGQPSGSDPFERGVLGMVLPVLDPAIADFSHYFDQIDSWALGDGSPADGDDRAHRRRVQLGLWSLLLSREHQISLSVGWWQQLSAAAYYLLVRFMGYRKSLATEWGVWGALVDHLDPLLLSSLPIAMESTNSQWRGLRQLREVGEGPDSWRTIAFREGGVCVLSGNGVYAVGNEFGCELSDGLDALAWIHREQGRAPWRLVSARSAPSKAGFRMVRGADERLIVSGRHGRILIISEGLKTIHQLGFEASETLSDLGPRLLGSDRVSLEMDRSAAWSGSGRHWMGSRGGEAAPIRLRLALSRKVQ